MRLMEARSRLDRFIRPEMKNPGFITYPKVGRGVARGLRVYYNCPVSGVQNYLETT